MKNISTLLSKYPASALYGAALFAVALWSSLPAFAGGAWDGALVDLVMAALLIQSMTRKISAEKQEKSGKIDRVTAWILVACANIPAFVMVDGFAGNLVKTFAFVLLFFGFICYFNGCKLLLKFLVPTLWCCVFIPFHEEFMLMASYPLRLSATMLSAFLLKVCGMEVVYSGSSLHLVDLNIAITDACSGINQLDAFILIAYAAVRMLHKKLPVQLLHIAFVVPSIIIANTVRIALTVWLYKLCGEVILGKFWHVTLGYIQIVIAFAIFIAIGKLFAAKPAEEEKK